MCKEEVMIQFTTILGNFLAGTGEGRTVGVPADIPALHLPNRGQRHYRCSKLALYHCSHTAHNSNSVIKFITSPVIALIFFAISIDITLAITASQKFVD